MLDAQGVKNHHDLQKGQWSARAKEKKKDSKWKQTIQKSKELNKVCSSRFIREYKAKLDSLGSKPVEKKLKMSKTKK